MYQNISGADKIIAIIGMKDGKTADADRIAEAADAFTESLSKEKLNVSSGSISVRLPRYRISYTVTYLISLPMPITGVWTHC